jgi:hypothetical protein
MAEIKQKPVVGPVEPVEPVPVDIKDKLQDMKNKKAAEQYQKTKKFAKGGYVRAADGCATKGKTKGRMV